MFMEEDVKPNQLTFCELADTGDSDALKSFSKTSVGQEYTSEMTKIPKQHSGPLREHILHHSHGDLTRLARLLLRPEVPLCTRQGQAAAEAVQRGEEGADENTYSACEGWRQRQDSYILFSNSSSHNITR